MESRSVWNVKEKDFPKKRDLVKKLKFLIRYAILAPSGHNTQPWRFIVSNDTIEIWPDYERRRSAVDPKDRELYISLGCASKNLEIAADYFGMFFDKEIKVDDKKALGVITFRFKNGFKASSRKELFKAILERQVNRSDYDQKPIATEIEPLKSDNAWVEVFKDKEIRKAVSNLIYTSNKVWFKTKELVEELDYWLQDDISGGHDGIPTGALNLYKLAANLKYFLKKDSDTAINKAERERQMAMEAPVLAIVETKMDGIRHWIEAGEIYEEMSLNLVRDGLSHAFFNTVIELKTQREKLAKILDLKGRPQMFFRIGVPKEKFDHTSRRPIDEVIISST